MTPKKTNRTNLENTRMIFFEYGAILTMALLLAAFEWGKELPESIVVQNTDEKGEVEILTDITRNEKTIPKPPVVPIEIIIVEEPECDFDDLEIPDIEKGETGPYNPIILKPKTEEPDNDPVTVAEEMPKYRKGPVQNFQKHVQELVEYPDDAISMGIKGIVYLQFVVNEKGILVNPQIVRSPDALLSNAVLEAIKHTEKWTPGKQFKIPVKVAFTIPVKFSLEEK